jgi:hypothetical protein
MRALGPAIVLCAIVACGGSDTSSPAGATTTVTSVSVTFPAGGTIFIGNAVQFEARETLSNGTTRVATSATWGSDAPGVATVSQTGLVTAIAAGQATIFADVNPRGTLAIRVFPDFGGSWTGNEILAGCQDSGAFEGLCADPGFLETGQVFDHRSAFTQNEASVDAELDTGDGTAARLTGTIAIDGELQLLAGPVLPADPQIDVEIRNWRSRADTPSRMTGGYEASFTAAGVPGSATISIQLQDVVKSGGSFASSSRGEDTAIRVAVRRIASHLRRSP